MADTVRNLMEVMIPELQDLEARGYFSKEEIRQIVKKRSDFEYLLKRKAAQKGDYLR
jgi:U3 small nucleolar RNA-associated protein 6